MRVYLSMDASILEYYLKYVKRILGFFRLEREVFMIYDNVARLCRDRGISIGMLEKTLGFGNGTVRRWRISSPTVASARKVADYFGVSLDALVGSVLRE